jgi:hypothetical protein
VDTGPAASRDAEAPDLSAINADLLAFLKTA